MSAWRLVVQALANGPMKAETLAAELGMSPRQCSDAIHGARKHGMVSHGAGRAVWMLTDQGRDMAAGNLVYVRRHDGAAWIPRQQVAELADVDHMANDLAQRLARLRGFVPSRELTRIEQFCAVALRVMARVGRQDILNHCRDSRDAWQQAGVTA